MKEVYGSNLTDFFNNSGIVAGRTYQKENKREGLLEIWEVTEEGYEKMCNMTEEEFNGYCNNDESWWRGASGSNMGIPDKEYEINGVKIFAWDGTTREDYHRNYCDKECSDMMIGYCRGTDKDIEECYHERKYPDLLTYLCDEIGASQPKNVCALATDLAKYNNMTMGKLFTKLQ